MHLNEIHLEPNSSYLAEGRHAIAGGASITALKIRFDTDEIGRVRAFDDGSGAIPSLANMWDYHRIRNVKTGISWDLRLCTAARDGDLQLATIALAEGVDVNLRIKQGATALHWAAAKGRAEIAALLVAHGADVNAVDDLGWLPAFLAAENGFPALAEMLIRHDARVECVIQGRTKSIATGSNPDDDLVEAAEAGDLAAARAALAAGADVNFAAPNGWTPLLSAADKDTPIVELLLAYGADPNLASDAGYTPLMRAAGLGKRDIVRVLLAAGADRSLRDWKGKRASELAREMHETDLAELIE